MNHHKFYSRKAVSSFSTALDNFRISSSKKKLLKCSKCNYTTTDADMLYAHECVFHDMHGGIKKW